LAKKFKKELSTGVLNHDGELGKIIQEKSDYVLLYHLLANTHSNRLILVGLNTIPMRSLIRLSYYISHSLRMS
jgi:hypothetical protein